jgi:hypothetical protein
MIAAACTGEYRQIIEEQESVLQAVVVNRLGGSVDECSVVDLESLHNASDASSDANADDNNLISDAKYVAQEIV